MAAKPCLYLTYSYFVLFPLPPHLSFPLFFANVGRLHYTLVLLKGKTNAALREQAHTPLKYLLCGIFVANTTTTTTKHYYCDLYRDDLYDTTPKIRAQFPLYRYLVVWAGRAPTPICTPTRI